MFNLFKAECYQLTHKKSNGLVQFLLLISSALLVLFFYYIIEMDNPGTFIQVTSLDIETRQDVFGALATLLPVTALLSAVVQAGLVFNDEVKQGLLVNTFSFGYSKWTYVLEKFSFSILLWAVNYSLSLGLASLAAKYWLKDFFFYEFAEFFYLIAPMTLTILAIFLWLQMMGWSSISEFMVGFGFLMLPNLVHLISRFFPKFELADHFLPFSLGADNPLTVFGYRAAPLIALGYVLVLMVISERVLSLRETK